MRERRVVDVTWSTKQGGADSGGTLVGYASTFGNVDRGGDVVAPGAFTQTIEELRASGGIPLLADHSASTSSVLGTIIDATEDERGLRIEALLSSAPSAQEVRLKLMEGHLSKLSIGYEVTDETLEERNGQRVRVLTAVKLWEVSVVVFPMNPAAGVTGVKSAAPADVAALDERLEVEAALLALAVENVAGGQQPPPAADEQAATEALLLRLAAKAAEHDALADALARDDAQEADRHREAAPEYETRARRERTLSTGTNLRCPSGLRAGRREDDPAGP